jgi:nucleoside-diphosphate-sugar epimerase
MKMVVIGGTGLIGSKAVAILRQGGHEVLAASPKNGVNSIMSTAAENRATCRRQSGAVQRGVF